MIGLAIAGFTYVRAYLVSRHQLGLEAAALRQQLVVFKRKQARPRLRRIDRFFWLALRRIWSGWAGVVRKKLVARRVIDLDRQPLTVKMETLTPRCNVDKLRPQALHETISRRTQYLRTTPLRWVMRAAYGDGRQHECRCIVCKRNVKTKS